MAKRLLVVDSDRRFIQDHKSPLESAFEVDFLYSTEGALSRLESGQYGAVLLCVETSENKGYALCAAIRRTLGDLKVALISGKATEEEYARHRGTKGKADLYLHKPILSTILIPALAEVAPLRDDEDPDNPLGDLAGSDLGDEWLESLKVDLDPVPTVPATYQPIAPAPAWASGGSPTGYSVPGTEDGSVDARMKELEAALAAQARELERKYLEIQELKEQNAAVTRNLDEAHWAETEAAQMQQRFLEQEELKERLQDELQEALEDAKRQVDLLEEANFQLSEKEARTEELQTALDLLQVQLDETRAAGSPDAPMEAALAQALERLQDLEALTTRNEQEHARLQLERDSAFAEVAAKTARIEELEAAQGRILELELDLEAVHAEEADNLKRIQELEASLGRTREQETGLRSGQASAEARVRELEGELASALEQVSFQELTLGKVTREQASLLEEKEELADTLARQAGEFLVLQDKVAHLEAAVLDLTGERDHLAELRDQLEAAAAGLEQRVAAEAAAHEAQQHELLAGIDEREAHLGRLKASQDGLRDDLKRLEQDQERQAALIQGRADQVQSLALVLAELEAKAREALALTKAVSD